MFLWFDVEIRAEPENIPSLSLFFSCTINFSLAPISKLIKFKTSQMFQISFRISDLFADLIQIVVLSIGLTLTWGRSWHNLDLNNLANGPEFWLYQIMFVRSTSKTFKIGFKDKLKSKLDYHQNVHLTFSWRKSLSYRNQSIDLLFKSMDWFLYDNGLRHERVKRSPAIK